MSSVDIDAPTSLPLDMNVCRRCRSRADTACIDLQECAGSPSPPKALDYIGSATPTAARVDRLFVSRAM